MASPLLEAATKDGACVARAGADEEELEYEVQVPIMSTLLSATMLLATTGAVGKDAALLLEEATDAAIA